MQSTTTQHPHSPLRARSLANLLADPRLKRAFDIAVPLLAAIGRLTLLVAREKLGKSTFARAAAAAVSCGAHFLGQPTTQGVVLWVVLEELLADVVVKFAQFEPSMDEIFLLQPSPERRFEELAAEIEAVRPRLIVIDTLSSYADGQDADENNSMVWTRLLGQLRRLAEEHNTAIILVHHATKRDGTYRGSTAIGASVDQIVEMHEGDANSTVRMMRCRGRWDIQDYSVRYDKANNSYAYIGEVNEPTERVTELARQRMRGWLAEHTGAGKTAITTEAGCKATTARAVFDDMIKDGEVVPHGNGYALAGVLRAA